VTRSTGTKRGDAGSQHSRTAHRPECYPDTNTDLLCGKNATDVPERLNNSSSRFWNTAVRG